jgi:hypothetical protein
VAELREVAGLLSHSGANAPDGVWDRIASSLAEVPPPLRLEVQRERGASRARLLPAIALSAAAAVLVVLGFSVVRLRGQVDDLRTAAAQAHATNDVALAATRAMNAPGTRIARLSGDHPETAVAVLMSNGQGYFLGSTLPTLNQQHIYELWGATASGQVTSLGTIPGPGVYAFSADPSVRVVMVTEENAPVPAPTRPAIVTGTLA